MSEVPGQLGSRGWAWLGRTPAWTWDAAPVAVLGADLALTVSHPQSRLLPGAAVALVAVLSLLARRRAPFVVLAVTGTATFVAIVIPDPIRTASVLSVLVALYTVDTRCSRRGSLVASSVALIGVIIAVLLSRHVTDQELTGAIAPAAVITALWVIGDNLRVRRAYVAGLEERAAWVDAQRAADARRAADDERARIARELHDVVAHHVAVMAVQAGAARMLNTTIDAQTRDLLGSIENAAHQAMSELRRLLGVLRREDGGRKNSGPQPGLGQLGQLIDQVRQAGLPAELTIVDLPHDLPDWVDLSAYRIVQEALTNVLKHVGPAVTRVCVRCDISEVTLIVTNQAPAGVRAPSQDRPGHGLVGMRERVAMAGGEVRAGPTGDGGFEVFARLPLEARHQAPPRMQAAGSHP